MNWWSRSDASGGENVDRAAHDAVRLAHRALERFPGVNNVEDSLPYGKQETILQVTPRGRALGMSTEVVHRYVLELRFDFGHVYWDRAGRIAKEILGLEGWDFEQIDMNHCRLSKRDLNVVFNFGSNTNEKRSV